MSGQFDHVWLNARLLTMEAGAADLGACRDGAVAALDGRIAFAGRKADLPAGWSATATTDCGNRWITPGLVDCHTHLVYGGDRAHEFERRLGGATYEEISREGGGIASSVRATRAASEEELIRTALPRLDHLLAEGVTTIEIKSGYGLDAETEARTLRAARALASRRSVTVRTTFLGAHAMPPGSDGDKDAFITQVCAMIPALAAAGLADAVDGFCEGIAFSPAQIRRVFGAARHAGLPVKLHADQLSDLGGAALAAEHGATSADHLEYASESGAAAMAQAGTVAVLLPGAYYALRETQAPPVAAFRRFGVPMAVATDANPGTSPLTSILLAMNMAATLFRLTVPECLAGVTREAARALGLAAEIGTLTAGKRCDLAIWDIERPAELVYRIGFNPLHARVWNGGGVMSVLIRPGEVALDQWRLIYEGAAVSLDPSCRPAVDAAAAVIDTIVTRGEPVYGVNTGFGKLASVRIDRQDLAILQRNIVLSHAAGVGDPILRRAARLMLALKVASLGQGVSGIRWTTLERLAGCLAGDLIPVVPGQGSVGASGDLAPLAHMTAALMGVGAFDVRGETVPAERALAEAGLAPLVLGPKEGLALLNGTQFSTALALAGLFEAERVFGAALVTGALSTDAARGSDTPFDPRIHAVRRHRGQIEVGTALRDLMAGSAIRLSHLVGDERVQDPYCLRCQPQVMGACLDILRQAAGTLALEANGVSDNPLVFTDTGEVLSGGNFHAEPVAFAADTIAMALCEIGSLAERRIAMLTDPALSGLPAFLTPRPGLNSGFMIPQVTAAALVSENKTRAFPASVDSIPTSANQEDHVSMAAHGARRLGPMAENVVHVIAIELLAAAQGCDFHAPLASSAPLEAARSLLRAQVPTLTDDRYFAPDIAAAAELVRSGALVGAAGTALPGIASSSPPSSC